MLRKFYLILFLFFSTSVLAQYTPDESDDTDKEKQKDEEVLENEKPLWLQNITVGGDFGLFFRGTSGYFGIGPKVGYQVTNWFNPGISFRYSYAYALLTNGQVFQNHTYGTGAFLHFRFFDKLFAGIEYEILNVLKWDSFSERTWANVLFLGAGYSQRLGGVGFMNVMLQYDVINDPNSPFRTSYIIGNPVTGQLIPLRFQVGFTFFLGKRD